MRKPLYQQALVIALLLHVGIDCRCGCIVALLRNFADERSTMGPNQVIDCGTTDCSTLVASPHSDRIRLFNGTAFGRANVAWSGVDCSCRRVASTGDELPKEWIGGRVERGHTFANAPVQHPDGTSGMRRICHAGIGGVFRGSNLNVDEASRASDDVVIGGGY